MADSAGQGGLGRLGWIIVGLGVVSIPLLRTPLSLADKSTGGPTAESSRRLCPSGIAYEPYCYGDVHDSIGVGSDLLAQFYGISRDSLRHNLACDTTVRAMIATLPDPVESRMANSTDGFLYAVGRAHESTGYVIDRFWLPWNESAPGTADPASAGALAGRPGAVLYRRSGWLLGDPASRKDPNLSLVYLVGETPTQGLDKIGFRRALADLQRLRATCPTVPLRILGPYFSGSAPSLSTALESLADGLFPVVTLVSGSATAFGNRRLNQSQRWRKVTFAATVHTDAAYKAALWIVTDSLGLGLQERQIALLTEQATAYGQSIRYTEGADSISRDSAMTAAHPPDSARAAAAGLDPQGWDSARGAGRDEFVPRGRGTRTLVINFPMSIATIRAAYEAADQAGKSGKDNGLDLGPRIPLTGGGSEQFRDALPTFSPVTIATQEIFLDQIAEMLSTRHILLAGLQATDSRDKLFLARELHRRLPNLQFYTFESNTLYLRSDYEAALKGMLVFSSYPLIPDPRRPGGPELFPSDPAFGVYNAALVHLGKDSLVNYAHSLTGVDSTTRGKLPVWVSVVGAGAIEPVRVIVDSIDDGLVPQLRPGRVRSWPSPTRFWYRLTLLLLVWMIALKACNELLDLPRLWRSWVAVLARLIRPGTPAPTPGSQRPARPDPDRVNRFRIFAAAMWERFRNGGEWTDLRGLTAWFTAESDLFNAFGAVVLVAALVPLCIVFGANAPGQSGDFWERRDVLALESGLPLVICLWLTVRAWRRVPRNLLPQLLSGALLNGLPESVVRVAVNVGAIWFMIVAILFAGGILLLPHDHATGLLFWARARALDARVSPLLVVLLVGFTIWFWARWHQKRGSLLMRPTEFETALSHRAEHYLGRFGRCWAEMRTATSSFRWHLAVLTPSGRAFAVLALGLIGTITLWPSTGHVLEELIGETRTIPLTNAHPLAFGFRWMLWFGLVTGLVLTVVSLERFLSLWGLLRKTLNAVDDLPINVALERLPPQVARLTQLVAIGEARSWRSWQEHRWMQLSNLAEPEPEVANTLEGVAEREARWDLAKAIRATPADQRVVRLMQCLASYWSVEPTANVAKDVQAALLQLKDLRSSGDALIYPLSGKLRRSAPDRLALWMRAAEEYAAGDIIEYVDWAMGALRRIAIFLAASLVVTSILLFAYPVAYERFVQVYFMALFLATVGMLGWVSLEINRNEVISQITRTIPGRLTWDRSLVSNLFILVGIPLVSYISAAYPEVHHLLLGWLEPISGSLTR